MSNLLVEYPRTAISSFGHDRDQLHRTFDSYAKILLFTWLVFASLISDADELPPLTSDVVLTLTGNLPNSKSATDLLIYLEMLKALPVVSFETETPWTVGVTDWEGVRISDLFAAIGVESERFKLIALDKYEVVFENVDIEKYPIILAYKRDGKYMSVRDLGPVWLMFPFADFPELDTQFNRTLSVWQLNRIEFL